MNPITLNFFLVIFKNIATRYLPVPPPLLATETQLE